nr:hypothetical protein [uncultured Mediterranean phage uvMED]
MSKEVKNSSPPGRPRLEQELQKRRNISLSDRLADKAAQIGKGNVSNGIRIAVEEYGN